MTFCTMYCKYEKESLGLTPNSLHIYDDLNFLGIISYIN